MTDADRHAASGQFRRSEPGLAGVLVRRYQRGPQSWANDAELGESINQESVGDIAPDGRTIRVPSNPRSDVL